MSLPYDYTGAPDHAGARDAAKGHTMNVTEYRSSRFVVESDNPGGLLITAMTAGQSESKYLQPGDDANTLTDDLERIEAHAATDAQVIERTDWLLSQYFTAEHDCEHSGCGMPFGAVIV